MNTPTTGQADGVPRRRRKLRVLVATSQTQGHRANDFHWIPEGELVTFAPACDNDRNDPDGHCGCLRSWHGIFSRKGSTTAVVDERSITRTQYVAALRDYYRQAFGASSDGVHRVPITTITRHAKRLLDIAADHPVGTVLERRGECVQARDMNPS